MPNRQARANRQAVEKAKHCSGRSTLLPQESPRNSEVLVFKREKRACTETGTARAIKNNITSGASLSLSRRGGARNSASRLSSALSLDQAANIIEATQFAAAIGLPLNRFLTVHWERAGVPDSRAAWATGRFLKLASDWVARRGDRIAWAWVRENGDGKGSHVHILLHLPAGLRIGAMPRQWVNLIAGVPYRLGTVKTRRIGGTADTALKAPAVYLANLETVVGYVLKGVAPATATALGIEREPEPQGVIVGKRAGTSQNIGRGARKGFRRHRASAREGVKQTGEKAKPGEFSVADNARA